MCATSIRRDRNHPSIIMWSIGNEIPEQNAPDGWKVAKRLTDIFHEEDRTRPTTAASTNGPPPSRITWPITWTSRVSTTNPCMYETDHARPSEVGRVWLGDGVHASALAACIICPIEKYEKPPSLQVIELRHHRAAMGVHSRSSNSRRRTSCRMCWANSSGPASIISANRRPTLAAKPWILRIGRPAVRISDCRSRGISQGPLLPLSERLDQRAHGAHAAALELGGREGRTDSGNGLHQRRRSGVVPERQIAGPKKAIRR